MSLKNLDQCDFDFADTDVQDIKKLQFKISHAKATGNDGLPIRFPKLAHETVVPILVYIINCN